MTLHLAARQQYACKAAARTSDATSGSANVRYALFCAKRRGVPQRERASGERQHVPLRGAELRSE